MSAPLTEEAIVEKFNSLRNEQGGLMTKVAEIEQDKHEHHLVLETLQPLDPGRTCHRLIGGVLIQRTVSEVIPEIKEHITNFDAVLKTMHEQLHSKEKEIEAFMATHKLRMASQGGGSQPPSQPQLQAAQGKQPGGGSLLA